MAHFKNIVQMGIKKFVARMNEGSEPILIEEIELGGSLV